MIEAGVELDRAVAEAAIADAVIAASIANSTLAVELEGFAGKRSRWVGVRACVAAFRSRFSRAWGCGFSGSPSYKAAGVSVSCRSTFVMRAIATCLQTDLSPGRITGTWDTLTHCESWATGS